MNQHNATVSLHLHGPLRLRHTFYERYEDGGHTRDPYGVLNVDDHAASLNLFFEDAIQMRDLAAALLDLAGQMPVPVASGA